MLGYTEHEIGNDFATWEKLLHPLDLQNSLNNVQNYLSGKASEYRNEARMRCKDGNWKWVLAQGAAVERDSDGNPLRVIGTHTDITETRRLEESVRELNENLEERVMQRTRELQLSRQDAELASLSKTRFLAAAGHDLRQPLAAANLFVDSLKFTSPTPRQSEIIAQLDHSMNTFSGLLARLLDISKFDAGLIKPQLAPFDLLELFNWLDNNFRKTAQDKQLSFRLAFPRNRSLGICSDLGLLQSVLMNLVTNAIKFTQHGGILVSARIRKEKIRIQVWDTGIGISAENLPSIFDEFYQVGNPQRSRESGLGLGLSICKRSMNLLGEDIKCRSRLKRGSVFELSLPIHNLQCQSASQPAIGASGTDAEKAFMRGKHVAMIEGDALASSGMFNLLRNMGAEVERFSNAEEALHGAGIMRNDFFITDYALDGPINGIEFLKHLRQKSEKPLIAAVISGDASSNLIRKTEACGWPVLFKPVSLPHLIASLGAQTANSQQHHTT